MKRQMKKNFILVLCLVMLFTQLQNDFIANAATVPELSVYYFSVGAADCALIRIDNTTMLVDTGNAPKQTFKEGDSAINKRVDASATIKKDDGSTFNLNTVVSSDVLSYLKNFLPQKDGKPYLDYMLITHYDSDHIGGLDAILKEVKVGKFLARKYSSESLSTMLEEYQNRGEVPFRNYVKLMNAVARNYSTDSQVLLQHLPVAQLPANDTELKKISLNSVVNYYNALLKMCGSTWYYPKKNETLNLYSESASKLTALFMHENTSYIYNKTSTNYGTNVNNDSLVFKLTYTAGSNSKSFMFLGDIGKVPFTNLSNYAVSTLNCDVLKMAHHGFKANQNDNVIANMMSPSYSIISLNGHTLGEDKRYICLFNQDYDAYLSNETLNSRYGKIYETWAVRAYVEPDYRARSYFGFKFVTNGSSLKRYAVYYDVAKGERGSVSITMDRYIRVFNAEKM